MSVALAVKLVAVFANPVTANPVTVVLTRPSAIGSTSAQSLHFSRYISAATFGWTLGQKQFVRRSPGLARRLIRNCRRFSSFRVINTGNPGLTIVYLLQRLVVSCGFVAPQSRQMGDSSDRSKFSYCFSASYFCTADGPERGSRTCREQDGRQPAKSARQPASHQWAWALARLLRRIDSPEPGIPGTRIPWQSAS